MDPYDDETNCKVMDVLQQIIGSSADEQEYEVVTVINFGQEGNEERMPLNDVRWDHQNKQLLLVQR